MSEDLLQQILSKLNTVEGKVDAIEGKVDAIEGRAGTIEGTVSVTGGQIAAIEENMATKEDVFRIEKKLDATFEQVAKMITYIVSNQERHERILEILSKRSIEQESYIRRSW